MAGFGFAPSAGRRKFASAVVARGREAVTGLGFSSKFGRTAQYDAGTAGDVFVDGANGSDGNDGLTPATPKATIAAGYGAVAAMSGERTLRIMGHGHRYREKVALNLLNPWPPVPLTELTIASYGTDVPYISGAEKVAGFAQCTQADEALLGPNYASVYKASISTTGFEHDNYWRLMLSENGQPLKLAVLRRAAATFDAFFTDATEPMFHEDSEPTLAIGTSGSGYFDTIAHSAQLPNYSDSQLEQAVAAVHAFPNLGRYLRVTSASASVLQLEASTFRPEANAGYALLNLPPQIEAGGWCYRSDGAGTLTLYVWPEDPASLANGIEIAVREAALVISKDDRPLVLEGIGLEMCSARPNAAQPGLVYFNQGDNITARQLLLDRFSGTQQHMAYFKFNENVTYENTTMRRGQGAFGVGSTDTGGNGIHNHRWLGLLAEDLSHTGFRCFGMRDSALVDCRAIRTSAGGHANLINFYLGCDNVLVVNFIASVADGERPWAGYATCQRSSRLHFLHCTITMAEDARAFVDQSVANDPHPVTPSENYLINCWMPHEPARLAAAGGNGGFVLGENAPRMNWHVYNSVVTQIASTGGTLTRRNNVLTGAGVSAADGSEDLAPVIDALHVDAAGNDFRAKAGGLLTTKAGFDIESLVTALEADFPDVGIRRDAAGRVWDPATPGIGPFGASWPSDA